MRFALTGLAALITVSACAGTTGTNDSTNGGGVTLQSIDLGTASQLLQPNDSISLAATGHYSDGSTKALTDSVSWTSDNASAISVSNDAGTRGRVKAVGTGTAMITATYSGKEGTATITAVSVTAIALNPTLVTVDSGATQQLRALATFSASAPGDPDVTTRATWTSSDTTKVRVNNDANKGLVTGVGGGSATIAATFKGVGGNTTITSVIIDSVAIANQNGLVGGYFPIGGTLPLRATAYYSGGNRKDVTDSVTWTSSTAAITVSNVGVASRVGEDSSFVQATFHGKKGTALLHKGCVVLAANLSFDSQNGGWGVANVKVDAGGVVWFEYDPFQPGTGGSFRTVPATGGTVQTIKSGIPFAGQWDMDASYIYWIWVDTQGAQTYKIVRMSRSSGAIDTLFNNGGIGGGSRGLAVDASYLYYAPGDNGGVRRLAKTGGAATAFFQNVNPFGPRTMSLGSGTVYAVVTDNSPHWIIKLPTNGSPVDTLGQANTASFSLVSGANFYWSENNPTNRIASVPTAGGTIATVATSSSSSGFTVEGSSLYYSQTSAGTSLVRSPLAGGAVQVVTDACGSSAATPIRVQYLASDGTYVYFSEDGAGAGLSRILRVKK